MDDEWRKVSRGPSFFHFNLRLSEFRKIGLDVNKNYKYLVIPEAPNKFILVLKEDGKDGL